jgi:signal transduction histidine kinase
MQSNPEEKFQEPFNDPEAIRNELLSIREQLKIVQAQLMESEKMATLGQLTAGIAHEIKNPLNFINNFSELSMELITELGEELQDYIGTLSEKDRGSVNDLLNDLKDNLGKINDHGKRADSIIRGMLLHSRGNAAEVMPTPINNLLAEYVNLAYHGMRATDNSFNIKIENDYDATVGNIPAIPQDLSRVFLNILNNAFYSTNEKKKELKETYSPLLTVSTRDIGQAVEIRLRDNGKGIPPGVMEKIFNAFYTTKPAGLGTGLGLSISHDIIVREHKGEIRVDSVEGEFAEFIIRLPK